MKLFERAKKFITQENLWIYLLTLGKEREIQEEKVREMIFERFGFLPPLLLTKRVIFFLKKDGYLKKEKYLGKNAFLTTEKGKKELEKLNKFLREILEKMLK
ncbi:MAG: hypothetical protein ACPLZH_02380 [Minisyncoccales bacterium]